MILFDTHILLWLGDQPDRIGRNSQILAEETLDEREAAFSAISFWEVAMLIRLRRIFIPISAEQWQERCLGQGVQELAVDANIATKAAAFRTMHSDPADRIIVATALHHRLPLLTSDRKILDWDGGLEVIDARV